MSIVTDLQAAVAMGQADAALLRAIVQGPATGPTSLVTTANGDVKTLARIAAEHDEAVAAAAAANLAADRAEAAIVDLVPPVVATEDYAVVNANELIFVDTIAAEVTITLRSAPGDTDRITIIDAKGMFSTHNCVIDGNGKTIGGTATSVRCREAYPVTVNLLFDADAGTWLVSVLT